MRHLKTNEGIVSMARKLALVLALTASLAFIFGHSSQKAKADDFLRNAAGAALIIGGVANMIQATQPQVNVIAPPPYPIMTPSPGLYANPYGIQPVQYVPQPVQYHQQPVQQPVQFYQQPVQQPVQYYQQPVPTGMPNVVQAGFFQ